MIFTSTEPNIFRMLFSIKNQKIMTALLIFHGEDGFLGRIKVQEAYDIIFFCIFDGNQHSKNIWFRGCKNHPWLLFLINQLNILTQNFLSESEKTALNLKNVRQKSVLYNKRFRKTDLFFFAIFSWRGSCTAISRQCIKRLFLLTL